MPGMRATKRAPRRYSVTGRASDEARAAMARILRGDPAVPATGAPPTLGPRSLRRKGEVDEATLGHGCVVPLHGDADPAHARRRSAAAGPVDRARGLLLPTRE